MHDMSHAKHVAAVLAALSDGIDITIEECTAALAYICNVLVKINATQAAQLAAMEAAARHAVSSLRSVEVTAGTCHEEIREIRHRLELDLDPITH